MSLKDKFCIQDDIDEIIESLGQISHEFSGKSILITGGRGFLGRYFVETFLNLNQRVLEKPCKIVCIDNLITAGNLGSKSLSQDNYTFIQHDIIQPLNIDQPFDFIMHCAGIASPYYYKAHPLKTLEVAVLGTKNTLELAKKHGARLLFFSSSEIYGDPDFKYIPTPESYRGNVSCLGPRACYDESKRIGETLCRIYHDEFAVTTAMVRPFNVYGPGMQETDYRVLPNFASQIIKGKPLKIYGTGKQTRTFCYIVDAIDGFLRTLVKGVSGEPYNIGNPSPEISMLELSDIIGEILGRRVNYDVVDYPDSYPADEPNRRCPDITKASIHLGYKPKVNINDGLRRFLRWAESNYSPSNR